MASDPEAETDFSDRQAAPPSDADHWPHPRQDPPGQATYGMSNLRPEKTGLPFIVFISQRDDAPHDVRVKVSPQPRVRTDQMGSYALRPFGHKVGPRLTTREERLLESWLAVNQKVLIDYWDGVIEYTEDATNQLRPV